MATRAAVADAATTGELRRTVLRPDQPPGSPMPGDVEDAIHLAAFDEERVVGAAVLLPRPFPPRPDGPAMQLRGMAVDPGWRGTGVGGRLFDLALDVGRSRGDRILWCNARGTARGFYERLGMQVDGPEFVTPDTGLSHYLMWREIDA